MTLNFYDHLSQHAKPFAVPDFRLVGMSMNPSVPSPMYTTPRHRPQPLQLETPRHQSHRKAQRRSKHSSPPSPTLTYDVPPNWRFDTTPAVTRPRKQRARGANAAEPFSAKSPLHVKSPSPLNQFPPPPPRTPGQLQSHSNILVPIGNASTTPQSPTTADICQSLYTHSNRSGQFYDANIMSHHRPPPPPPRPSALDNSHLPRPRPTPLSLSRTPIRTQHNFSAHTLPTMPTISTIASRLNRKRAIPAGTSALSARSTSSRSPNNPPALPTRAWRIDKWFRSSPTLVKSRRKLWRRTWVGPVSLTDVVEVDEEQHEDKEEEDQFEEEMVSFIDVDDGDMGIEIGLDIKPDSEVAYEVSSVASRTVSVPAIEFVLSEDLQLSPLSPMDSPICLSDFVDFFPTPPTPTSGLAAITRPSAPVLGHRRRSSFEDIFEAEDSEVQEVEFVPRPSAALISQVPDLDSGVESDSTSSGDSEDLNAYEFMLDSPPPPDSPSLLDRRPRPVPVCFDSDVRIASLGEVVHELRKSIDDAGIDALFDSVYHELASWEAPHSKNPRPASLAQTDIRSSVASLVDRKRLTVKLGEPFQVRLEEDISSIYSHICDAR